MIQFTRRKFMLTAASAIGASMLPLAPGAAFGSDAKGARATARYRRYNVSSPEGQRMLASYARGVEAMLKLPADHPQNWFRNAFVHFMDCPHGNWWFYVWHRGYVGYFERTIRRLSGDPGFAMPYWDWTQQPEIPAGMFNGVLAPTDKAYEPYTGNLAKFTAFIKPALQNYWNQLSPAQRAQLDARGYQTFDQIWNDVTGFNTAQDTGISGNMAFAITCGARYLSRSNPKLDEKTTYDVSPYMVTSGLQPTEYYNPYIHLSFTSSKTPSHNTQPNKETKFSILEGFPHNKVHNCIGGVAAIDPGPYGNMTNFLSPVDPIFFLHHANMDRLWDVWTQKQIARGLPILPSGDDLATLADEPFLFYVDGNGQYAGPHKAGEYFSMSAFEYDYAPGFGSAIPVLTKTLQATAQPTAIKGSVLADIASVELPNTLIKSHLADQLSHPLVAEITLPRPSGLSNTREFDVLVNAPAEVTQVGRDSPYYAGTIAFFGPVMPGMKMAPEATFAVPLPKTLRAFSQLGTTRTKLDIRLVPSSGQAAHATPVHAATITAS